jgi:hypothetical protein
MASVFADLRRKPMHLWNQWWSWVEPLRGACSRSRSFLWLAAALAGMSIRGDLLGVTGIIRALGFCEGLYDRLLDFFRSSAVDCDALSRCVSEVSSHSADIFEQTLGAGRR